jgi:hypothetical protein
MPVKKRKMSKKSAKEIINPDIKRITIFCINIRPGWLESAIVTHFQAIVTHGDTPFIIVTLWSLAVSHRPRPFLTVPHRP